MNSSEFITAIKEVVLKSSIEDTILLLESPPGRKPEKHLVFLSNWYNGLDEDQKIIVMEIIQIATHGAIFGFLTVLDGVRAIEGDSNKGSLELSYVVKDDKYMLNDPSGPMLHDLL